MPFTKRQSLGAAAVGVLTDALAIALGLAVPLGDPLRDRVDNSLLLLGCSGVLIALLAPRSRLVSGASAARVALALYGALSLTAVLLADFGDWVRLGWGIKIAAAGAFALAVRELRRPA